MGKTFQNIFLPENMRNSTTLKIQLISLLKTSKARNSLEYNPIAFKIALR